MGKGDHGGKKGKGLTKNINKGPKDLYNGVGIDCGSGGWDGQRRKKLGQL